MCLRILSPLTVIYYKIKFFTCLETNRNIIDNVPYVDQVLESLQISVPHLYNNIEYSLYLIVESVFLLLCYYRSYIARLSSILADSINLSTIIYFWSVDFSNIVLFLYCYLMTKALRQRLQLTSQAFGRCDKQNYRNNAWSDRETVAVVYQPRHVNIVEDVTHTYKLLGSAYRTIYESLEALNRLYSIFYRCQVCGLILWLSTEIISTTVHKNIQQRVFPVAIWFSFYVVFLYVHGSVTRDLKYVKSILSGYYYKTLFKKARNEILVLIYRSAHRETNFHCGYFDIDFSVFSIIIDFIPLIVFNVLERSN